MWTPLTAEHIPLVEQAFDRLGSTRRSHYVSYLAEPGLMDFHRDRWTDTLQKDLHCPLYGFLADSKVLAMIGTLQSEWHTLHFDVPYFKLHPFFFFTQRADEIASAVRQLNTVLKDNALYTTRIDSHHYTLAYHLAQSGFIPVGTSVRMILDISDKKRVDSQNRPFYDTCKIRPYSESDLPQLQDIIRRSHRYSHFFGEVRFPPERIRGLFAEYIGRCACRPVYSITVAESNGVIAGFCSALVQKSLQSYIHKSIGIIDFIVVDYQSQGRGIGRAMLEAVHDGLNGVVDLVELRTMADNIKAIRFYENNGYRMLSTDHHLHCWTGG